MWAVHEMECLLPVGVCKTKLGQVIYMQKEQASANNLLVCFTFLAKVS